jgi:hypothetical protein
MRGHAHHVLQNMTLNMLHTPKPWSEVGTLSVITL